MKEVRMEAKANMRIGGRWQAECYRWHDENGIRFRDNKGRFERRLMWVEDIHNIWTNEGLDHILNVEFHATTQITTWYCLLFETDTTPSGTTTYATPVFTETSSYDEAARPAYVEAASSSQSITNTANKAVFTISATKTMYGAALVGGGTNPTGKVDKTSGGTMAVAGKFGTARSVVDDDVINLTYAVGAADDGV
jgi:hypothetical protein